MVTEEPRGHAKDQESASPSAVKQAHYNCSAAGISKTGTRLVLFAAHFNNRYLKGEWIALRSTRSAPFPITMTPTRWPRLASPIFALLWIILLSQIVSGSNVLFNGLSPTCQSCVDMVINSCATAPEPQFSNCVCLSSTGVHTQTPLLRCAASASCPGTEGDNFKAKALSHCARSYPEVQAIVQA